MRIKTTHQVASTVLLTCLSLLLSAQEYKNAFKIQSTANDRGMRITTDGAGMVITTGYFAATADFDPGAGTANLTPSGSFEDVYLAKYDSLFNYQWAVNFGTSGADKPYALSTDAANNIYVGGDVSTNSRDGFLNKYDVNGNLLWSVAIGGSGKDVVYGVAVDAAANIYVTGYFSNTVDFDPSAGAFNLTSNGGRDIFLAKYDSAGSLRWAFNAGGTISTAYEEGGQDLVVNGADIYLTGNFEGTADFDPGAGTGSLVSNGMLDIFLAKYDTAGNYNWAFSAGSASKHDFSYGIDVDGSGNLYITGGFEEKVDFDPSGGVDTLVSASSNAQDIFLAKYDQAGAYQWALQVGGNTSVDDHAFDIEVTPAGEIFITGEVWGPADFDPSPAVAQLANSNDQIFFAKYDAAGNFHWVFEVGTLSSNGSADNGFGVHVGQNEILYATGDFSGTADFDPGAGTANLVVDNSGHAFVAAYKTHSVTALLPLPDQQLRTCVYPNPSCGEITIDSGDPGSWTLQVTDLNGKLIYLQPGICQKAIALSVKSWPGGIYICTCIRDGKTVSTKIRVE